MGAVGLPRKGDWETKTDGSVTLRSLLHGLDLG